MKPPCLPLPVVTMGRQVRPGLPTPIWLESTRRSVHRQVFFRELPNDFFLSYRRLVEAATPPLAGSAGPTLVPRGGTPPSGRAHAPPSVALQRGTARSPAGSADAIGSRKADWQGWGFPLWALCICACGAGR